MAALKKVFISAGEASSDLYAALFLRRHQPFGPDVALVGVGGPQLAAIGTRILVENRQLSVFGFARALSSIQTGFRTYRRIARLILQQRPDIFLAVAYPGLNILLCRFCKRHGIRTVYLLPPQIWAWAGFRKYFLRRYTDEVISFFRFEADSYRKRGIDVRHFSNPLLDHVKPYARTRKLSTTVGLMPGSRPSQVRRHLPIMIDIARRMRLARPDLIFRVILTGGSVLPFAAPDYLTPALGNRHRAMAECRLMILSSGTASLEAALMSVPQIFVHYPTRLDRLAARLLVHTKEFSLVNIILGEPSVPVRFNPDPAFIAEMAIAELSDVSSLEKAQRRAQAISQAL
jgi:lipid-A-disaccharide synthase